jgi:hypothetical protein
LTFRDFGELFYEKELRQKPILEILRVPDLLKTNPVDGIILVGLSPLGECHLSRNMPYC